MSIRDLQMISKRCRNIFTVAAHNVTKVCFINSCRSFKMLWPTLHVLAMTLRAFHDVVLLDSLLTSIRIFFFTINLVVPKHIFGG